MWVVRSMSVLSVSVVVAIPCLIAAFEHFLQPLRRNQARATRADCRPHMVVPLPDLSDRRVEVPPAVLTTMTSWVRFQSAPYASLVRMFGTLLRMVTCSGSDKGHPMWVHHVAQERSPTQTALTPSPAIP